MVRVRQRDFQRDARVEISSHATASAAVPWSPGEGIGAVSAAASPQLPWSKPRLGNKTILRARFAARRID